MCGIYFGAVAPSLIIQSLLRQRGPDCQVSVVVDGMHVHSTVLHMRGDAVTSQPIQSTRYCLQWNGEIFGFTTETDNTLWSQSDTIILFDRLESCKDEQGIINLLFSIEGPFAVVIFDTLQRVVYFGRDRFGRRSLLRRVDCDGILLCSVGDGNGVFEEVSASGIHKYSLESTGYHCFEYPRFNIISSLVHGDPNTDYTDMFLSVMKQSVQKRLVHVNKTVTVLFSGGVDSLLIAAILCLIAPSLEIELVNVAFSVDSNYDSVPDRQTGIVAFEELCAIFKHQNIVFTERNVHIDEYQSFKERVSKLMYPNISVMDESIAMALWFAARNANSRVLMVGMGADEQFGGYTRHATRFRREGYVGLHEELQLDVDRISSRNLGRDDRVISDNSVEARYPFLDEQVVRFSCEQVPLDQKWNEETGENKWIVRDSLRRLGFSNNVASATKRAIQFGARTAKMQQHSSN